MRWGFYLMTVTCCGVLAAIFYERGQIWWAAGILLIALLYLARGFAASRQDGQKRLAELEVELARPQTSSEKKVILQDLLKRRKQLRQSKNLQMLGGFCLIVAAVIIQPTNSPLALAILVLLLPVGYLVWRNTKKIMLIENGLEKRNLLPDN